MTEALPDRERIAIDGGPNSVVLRQLTREDGPRYVELIARSDPEHFRNVGEPTYDKYRTVEDFEDNFDTDPEKVRLGIWAGGEMVGSINYSPSVDNTAHIGYWIGEEYARQGHATKATRALVGYLFETGWGGVEAWARADNEGSRRTLLAAGMNEWGPDATDLTHIRYGLRYQERVT